MKSKYDNNSISIGLAGLTKILNHAIRLQEVHKSIPDAVYKVKDEKGNWFYKIFSEREFSNLGLLDADLDIETKYNHLRNFFSNYDDDEFTELIESFSFPTSKKNKNKIFNLFNK